MSDLNMGYTPAMHEQYHEPNDDDWLLYVPDYPLGLPRRVRDEIERERSERYPRPVMAKPMTCVTGGDYAGFSNQTRLEQDGLRAIQACIDLDPLKRHDEKIADADAHAKRQEQKFATLGLLLR